MERPDPRTPGDTSGGGRLLRPLRWTFLLALALVLAGWAWAFSLPVPAFLPSVALFLGLAVLGVVWLALLAHAITRLAQRRPYERVWWLAIAPAAVVVTAGLLVADVPLQARWQLSRPAFEEVADGAAPGLARTETRPLEDGGRIGSYQTWMAYQQGEAVIFHVRGGGFIDDSGFAYLPEGPFPELETGSFERPEFTSLGGGWYRWTASW